MPIAMLDGPGQFLLSQMADRARTSEGSGIWLTILPIDNRIEEAITLAEDTLVPAGRDNAARALDLVVVVLSCRRPEPRTHEVYVRLLAELPADLLGQSVKAALSDCTYHKLPPPGCFLQPVRDLWDARRELLRSLRRHANRIFLARRRVSDRSIGI